MLPRFAALIVALALAGCVAAPPAMPPGSDPSGTMVGNGILEGSVVDENFVPVAAATVSLLGTDHTVETTWNGHFRFTNLPPAIYRLSVTATGWAPNTVDARVQPDFATRLTIFLAPDLELHREPTLEMLTGKITCVEGVEGYDCEQDYQDSRFPADWAAMVIEVDWSGGVPTSNIARITAEDRARGKVFADLIAEAPAKMILWPSTVHDGIGGRDPTPEDGVAGPLEIGISMDPVTVGGQSLGATLNVDYNIYVTTFYFEAPEDLESYTAMPDS